MAAIRSIPAKAEKKLSKKIPPAAGKPLAPRRSVGIHYIRKAQATVAAVIPGGPGRGCWACLFLAAADGPN